MSSTSTYQVTGMTCGHCAQSVSTEVGSVAGVTDVRVDLASGAVTVISTEALDTDQVREAVQEAGYQLVD